MRKTLLYRLGLLLLVMLTVQARTKKNVKGNYAKLFKRYPQIRNNKYNACYNSISNMLMTWNSEATTVLNEYSLHFYTDLGSYKECESEANGSYIQLAL